MDKTGLDGAFLAGCCRFTTLALVVASVLISAVVSYLGIGHVLDTSLISDHSKLQSHVPENSVAQVSSANLESQEYSNLHSCQPTDRSSVSIDGEARETIEWRPAYQASVEDRTGYLKLDHLAVDTVVASHDRRGFRQLTLYFSNFSCLPGMVQVRPEIEYFNVQGAEGSCNETSTPWQKRRVPRHGQLAYTVAIPCSGHASSLTLYVRGFSSDRVLTVRHVGTFAKDAQFVENKINKYIGSTLRNTGFHDLPESERPIADKI
ncbi:MAG: hypothetical protein AB8B63_17635 [Granulosicoccus sp.]